MPGNCSPYKKNSSPNRLEPIFCLSCNHETQIQRQHNKIHNSRFWSVYIFTRTNCCYFLIKVLWLPVCPPWLNYFWPSPPAAIFWRQGTENVTLSCISTRGTTWDLRTIWIHMYLSVLLFSFIVVVVVVVFHELHIGGATRDMQTAGIFVPLLFCTTYIFRTWVRS